MLDTINDLYKFPNAASIKIKLNCKFSNGLPFYDAQT